MDKNDGRGFVLLYDVPNDPWLHVLAKLEMDGYKFRCHVSYGRQSEYTNTATLTVKPATPSFIKEPKSIAVNERSTAEFATGINIPRAQNIAYTWQVDRGDGNGFVDFGCATQTLSFRATADMDGYLFRCIVAGENGNQRISKAASLEVFKVLEIANQPQDLVLYEKQKGAFSFDLVERSGKKLKYTWLVDKNDGKGWKKAGSSKDLKISASLKMDGWRYCCEASNGEETETSNVASLTVYQNAKITQKPSAQKVYEYEDAKFEVEAEGHDVKYQWQYYNEISKQWINIQGATLSSYEPGTDFEYDGRKFRCVVSNGGGTAISSPATLTVMQLPAVLDSISIIQDGWEMAFDKNDNPYDSPIVFEEYSATLRAFARGYKIKYQWQVLEPDSEDWQDIKGATKSTYTIKEITQKNNARAYRCKVYNDDCEDVSNGVELTVIKPFAPKSLKGQSFYFPDAEQINILAFTSASGGALIGYGGSKITGVKYKRLSFDTAQLKFTLQIKMAGGKIYKQTFDGVADLYNGYFYCDYNPKTDTYDSYYELRAARETYEPMPQSMVGKTFYFDFLRDGSQWLEVAVESAKTARYELYDDGEHVATFRGSFSYKQISEYLGTFSGSFKDGIYTVKISNGVMALDDGAADPYYNMEIDGYFYSGRAYFE